jgi:hypothetical protein
MNWCYLLSRVAAETPLGIDCAGNHVDKACGYGGLQLRLLLVAPCSVAQHRRERLFTGHIYALDHVNRPAVQKRLSCGYI